MGQILHGSATTTEAVRRAIQHSQASLRALAKRYGINQKTVAKWKGRTSVADLPTGPKEPRSTVLSVEEEAVVVAFRRHALLPLDDCLYALQPTIPHLTRSSLCIAVLSATASADRPKWKATKSRGGSSRPIRSLHVDLAEVQTAQGKPGDWKTLNGLTPYEFICKRWTIEPRAFWFWVYAYPAFLRYAAHSAGG